MPNPIRVAFFLDYENFSSTLRSRSLLEEQPCKVDFLRLVGFIHQQYGTLQPEDFIAVANFSHYDRQKGGLNQVATIVHVDSFEVRKVRNQNQSSPGKKHVMKDFSDFRLAYEIGKHTAQHPADLYILGTGDKAFSAVGQALLEQGFQVIFLLAHPIEAAVIIKENFKWFDYGAVVPLTQIPLATQVSIPEQKVTQPKSLIDELCEHISLLRQEFSTPIPQILIKAMYGSEKAHQLLQAAQSEGRIDIWDDPSGVACLSRREERVFNKVITSATRKEFVNRATFLYAIVKIAEKELKEPTRAEWRRALKDQGNLSVKEAKFFLNYLLEQKILIDGNLAQPQLTIERIVTFLKSDYKM